MGRGFAAGVAPILGALVALVGCGRGPAVGPGGGSLDADWTVLVYVVADNDLERAAIVNIYEMAEVGSGRDVNVVVQIDRGPAMLSSQGFSRAPLLQLPDFTTTKRLLVKPGAVTELGDLGELNAGAPSTLADFVAWGIETFPARKIALVLWNHGGATAGFGWDWTSDRARMEIPQVHEAIAGGLARAGRPRLDLLGFDACLMANLEIAYELRDVAGVLVASEENEPLHGWSYPGLLQSMSRRGSPADVGRAVVDSYAGFCRAKRTVTGCTMSVIDETRIEAVARAVDDLGRDLAARLSTDAGWHGLARARADSEAYGLEPGISDPYHVIDLADFAGRSPADPARTKAVVDAVDAAVIAGFRGDAVPHARGLSVSVPAFGSPPLPTDARLAFAGLGGWQELLRGVVARAHDDVTPPEISAPVVRLAGPTRGYDVSATVAGGDIALTYGAVGRPGPGDVTTILSAARLVPGTTSFHWDQRIDVVTDGVVTSPLTMFEERVYTDGAGRRVRLMSTELRIIPADGDGEPYEVTAYVDVPDAGEPELRALYEYDDDGSVSEVDPDETDRFEPLLYGLDEDDEEVWTPSGISLSLADDDALELRRVPAPAGDYLVGVVAIDDAGHETENATPVTVR